MMDVWHEIQFRNAGWKAGLWIKKSRDRRGLMLCGLTDKQFEMICKEARSLVERGLHHVGNRVTSKQKNKTLLAKTFSEFSKIP